MIRQELIDDIKYIKEVISSSIHYTNLSGFAAILSGIAVIAGCFLSQRVVGAWRVSQLEVDRFFKELAAIWLCVFVISVIAHIFFIGNKAKKTGQPAWSRVSRLVVYALSPPLLIGACFTVFLVHQNMLLWIPGIWMLCYGLGVWSAGLFSIPEARRLASAFMISGLITLFYMQTWGLITLAVSFGGFHLVYGIKLCYKYGGY